jgi:serine/threonine protein phosphatase PrpC
MFIQLGMIAVTRAIGDHNMKRVGYVRNDIYFTMIELAPTDDYLILACDGVCECLIIFGILA